MTELADRTIDQLRRQHDTLATLVGSMGDDDLARTSGSSEWTIAQVLSHLGSGAEIGLATVRGDEPDNESIWARWDGSSPREQAEGFLEHDERLVAYFESLDTEARSTATVALPWLPEPLALSSYAGLRANEVVHHAWDVRVGLDEGAVLADDAAALMAEHYAGGLAFLLGFSAKPDALDEAAVVVLGDSGFALDVSDAVRVTSTPTSAPTATFHGPLESAVRLLVGRLDAKHTADDVRVEGNVSLDDLRAVFPGY